MIFFFVCAFIIISAWLGHEEPEKFDATWMDYDKFMER